jgi:hypothetical protein
MSLKEQTVAELQRRVALLPAELAEWKARTTQSASGLGIHNSQIEAITDFFEERIALHNEILADLEAAPDDRELAYLRSELEAELGGAHGLMAVFRHILAQRLDTDRYRGALDAADLIAADCYRPCIALALDWKVLDKGQFRVPPLTFLNARSSPQALTREKTFKAFGFDLDSREMQMRLPFSFVSLRYHDTESIWSFCTIHHEVGHLLDEDLDLDSELGELLAASPEIDPARVPLWAGWLKESIADAFGVLLGGAGFALALTDTLFLPVSEVLEGAVGVHPPPTLRIFLLGALLRRTMVPELADIAGEIEDTWQQIYGGAPPAQAPFLDDCAAMARLLLSKHLIQRLQNRRLRDLVPGLSQDHSRVQSLALHLRGEGPAPDPATYPLRLAPAAARLALRGVGQSHAAVYAEIHRRALVFAGTISQPAPGCRPGIRPPSRPTDEIMGPGILEAEQKQYLREMSRRVRFSRPE